MKIQLTLTIEPETPEGWDTPADAQETANALRDEISGMDYMSGAVQFFVAGVVAEVLEP